MKIHEDKAGWLSRKDGLIAYHFKRETYLGCTVIDLVMKIKHFKGVNTKAWRFLFKNNTFRFSFLITSWVINVPSKKTEILCI